MGKFHINAQGVPAPCRATKGNCPFGGESGNEDHYDSKEEAQVRADEINEQEYGLIASNANEVALDSFVDIVGEEDVVADFAYELNEEDLQAVNDTLIERNDLDVYDGDLSEQMIDIAENSSYQEVLSEIEVSASREGFNNVISKMEDKYNTSELKAIQRDLDWQLRRTNVDAVNSTVDLNNTFSLDDDSFSNVADRAIQQDRDFDNTRLEDVKEVFTDYSKLDDHRTQFYKQSLDMDTAKKIEIFNKAIEETESETEHKEYEDDEEYEKEESVSEAVSRIQSSEENDERTFSGMLNVIKGSQWGGENKYFNKADKLLKVDSRKGFTPTTDDADSKSIYLDNEGVSEEEIKKRDERLNKRNEIYKEMTTTDTLKMRDAMKSLNGSNLGGLNSLAKNILSEDEFKKVTSEKGSMKERWQRLEEAGRDKYGHEGFVNKSLDFYVEKGDRLEQLDKLDVELNMNSNRKATESLNETSS